MKYIKSFTIYSIYENMVATNGRNIDYNKALFDEASKFFIKELFGNDNVNITISFSQVNKGSFGDIDLFDTISNIRQKKFDLRLDKNTNTDILLGALAHELTHIKQVYKGELDISSDNQFLMWQGRNAISVTEYNNIISSKNINRYVKLAWEQEAYANQKLLPVKLKQGNINFKNRNI
jgi:hypothetical protein